MIPTRLQIESWSPLLLGVLAALVSYYLDWSISNEVAKELLSAIISAAAVGAGFLTTALSILMTMGGTAIGRQIKRRGKLTYLYRYIRSAIYSCLLLVAVCVAAFISFDKSVGLGVFVSTLIAGVAVYCMVSMTRIIEILVCLFAAMSEPSDIGE